MKPSKDCSTIILLHHVSTRQCDKKKKEEAAMRMWSCVCVCIWRSFPTFCDISNSFSKLLKPNLKGECMLCDLGPLQTPTVDLNYRGL